MKMITYLKNQEEEGMGVNVRAQIFSFIIITK